MSAIRAHIADLTAITAQLLEDGQTEAAARRLKLDRYEASLTSLEAQEAELMADQVGMEQRKEDLKRQLAAQKELKLKARMLNKKKSELEMIHEDLTTSKEL